MVGCVSKTSMQEAEAGGLSKCLRKTVTGDVTQWQSALGSISSTHTHTCTHGGAENMGRRGGREERRGGEESRGEGEGKGGEEAEGKDGRGGKGRGGEERGEEEKERGEKIEGDRGGEGRGKEEWGEEGRGWGRREGLGKGEGK